MKTIKIEIAKVDGLTTAQQFVKLIVGSAAGFGATKLAEKAIMTVIKRREDIAKIVQA